MQIQRKGTIFTEDNSCEGARTGESYKSGRYLEELWLDGGRVDALVVEERLDVIGHAHVVLQVLTRDVRGGDDAVACQLPHVELVNGNDSVHLRSTRHTCRTAECGTDCTHSQISRISEHNSWRIEF